MSNAEHATRTAGGVFLNARGICCGGQNLPISPSQVQQVLGDGTLSALAKRAGAGVPETASALASLLPKVVDGISPGGKAPAANNLGGLLAPVGKLLG